MRSLSEKHGHDEIEKYSCPVCVRELGLLDDDDKSSEIETMVDFIAQFEGPCGYRTCRKRVRVGDEVSLVVYDDDNKVTMHRDCATRQLKESA